MDNLHISEFWMPAFIGAFAFPLLSFLGWLMTRMPQPTDKELRTERELALDTVSSTLSLFKNFMPVLVMFFFANLFVTVLQDIKEDFLVNIIDVSGYFFMGLLPSGRYGDFDNSGYVRGMMSMVKEQRKGILVLLGYGYLVGWAQSAIWLLIMMHCNCLPFTGCSSKV